MVEERSPQEEADVWGSGEARITYRGFFDQAGKHAGRGGVAKALVNGD